MGAYYNSEELKKSGTMHLATVPASNMLGNGGQMVEVMPMLSSIFLPSKYLLPNQHTIAVAEEAVTALDGLVVSV